ncbi:MAG TPA: hypothetical protein VF173_17135 [Thermoanaerobaculia bacterium]|nr:hypothetical protein [Thermoanaerobaculia bacterium]
MQIHDELWLEELSEITCHKEVAVEELPPWETIQSALYGAIRFAESFLGAGVCLSRMICTPDARLWTLAFGEHFFTVEVVSDGFSVHLFRRSVAALAA